MNLLVTDPIRNDGSTFKTNEPTAALGEALKSALEKLGYTDVPAFLQGDDNWINIEFVVNGGANGPSEIRTITADV